MGRGPDFVLKGGAALISRGFRERIAVSLLGAALVMGAVLGVMTVRSFTQPASSAVAVEQGQVSGAQAGASAAPLPGAPGPGGSPPGDSGGVSGGNITIGGF